jgi:hypothetical protein
MLPFERAMSIIAYNDRAKINKPTELFGEEADNFDQFFSEHFHSENYDLAAVEFIKKINKNDNFFNYLSYLDYKIKGQEQAMGNAYRDKKSGLGDYISKDLEQLKRKKSELEASMILEGDDIRPFAQKMRKGAEVELVKEILREGKLPSKWESRTNNLPGPQKFDFYSVSAWAKTGDGQKAIREYVKKRGPMAFKGVTNTDQLELIVWDNMLEPMKHLVIGNGDVNGKMYREKMAEHVKQFKKDYAELWSDTLNGKDAIHDQSRANAEVMHWLEEKFLYWEDQGGYGRLFILKLMAPETQSQTVTYLKMGQKNAKILPAFKNESLSYIKLGLRFFNQSELIDSPSKEIFFNYISSWHNQSFRAFYGQRADHTNPFTSYLSDLTNERLDILRGSPLLDDIAPYNFTGGLQQREINPHVARALGLETNESIASFLYNEPLFAKDIQTLRESTLMSYLPIAYINAGVKGKAHPSIHGYKSYNRAVKGAASALLGDALHQNLVFGKAYNHFKGAYNNTLEADNLGKNDINAGIDSKINCKN